MLLVLLISGVLLLVMTFLSDAGPSGERSIFGVLSVKETDTKKRQHTSNYERVKDTKSAQSELRYKVRRRKENPFFSLYRAEQATAASSENPTKSTSKRRKRQRAFFDLMNSDALDKSLFEAVFRERQHVQRGRALRLFLEEPIHELKLKAGTVLKGIPELEGDRVKIRITAAKVGGTMKPIELLCLDQEDCLEGVYHDALAARMEKATQEGLLEELWSLGLSESEALQKGRRIAHRLTGDTQERITIESGRKVFVMLPEKNQ